MAGKEMIAGGWDCSGGESLGGVEGRIDYKDTLHNDMVKLINTKVEWVFHVAGCKPPMDSSLELIWFRDPKFVEKNKKKGKAVIETMLMSNYGVYSFADKLRSLKGSKDLNFSQIFHSDDAVVLSVVGDQNLLVLHTVSGSDVTRIWVSNQVDEEAKDLSWNCDFVFAVDFHLSSLMNMESVRSEPNHPFDTFEHKLF
ncbi:hypothetical protein F2Q68_00015052 [Brassica cretica]|uniref:F-box associated domain-containing protein n=2 Tax=Brassica cretica TaxID=69181 RepID=A0A8S9HI98_BRACR|nr:hypothetical protein F2Q68_00015052 [Brassica cretica]KAF3608629.1 hypothetical protein DY000_02047792 [Brassica cretica]